MASLFDQLVAECGLSKLFAQRSLERACTRAGLQPEKLQRADLPKLLPILEQTLRVYLPADEANRRLDALIRL